MTPQNPPSPGQPPNCFCNTSPLSLTVLGEHLDILAISCDSFDEATNKKIGRGQGQRSHLRKMYQIKDWCAEYKVLFKINTVVNTHNVDEDMAENIAALGPVRWKVSLNFKVVLFS